MSNIAVTRAPELDELLERTQAHFDVLKAVKTLRDQRSELLRQVAEIDHQLGKFDDPLRTLLLDQPGPAAARTFRPLR
ncbi:MAG: hypothetical protein KGL35_12160 [Bradyrhizobium sp.]|nr:hypothetical protein [Bradyrhizobium sp.]